MAITITRKPALFFNCTSPVIFEFTTDSTVGNFDDYVCDLYITSQYSSKTAKIPNIFPNTKTKIFTVDASEFFKALQLNGFEFDFAGTKNLSIEKFTLNFQIRNGADLQDDAFVFDNYVFDNFVFTEGVNSVDTATDYSYSILGERLLLDSFTNPIVEDKNTFLEPTTIEVANGFDNVASVFINERTANIMTVAGITSAIANVDGVAHHVLSAAQVEAITSLREITVNNQNPAKSLWAFPFNYAPCDKVVQFRFFNSKGGYSQFFAVISDQKGERTKVEFYNRNFNNENENKSPAVQSGADYLATIDFKGTKIAALKENFDLLLRSPKVEINLKSLNGNDLFIECEVTGSAADRYTHFDFALTAKIKNTSNFAL